MTNDDFNLTRNALTDLKKNVQALKEVWDTKKELYRQDMMRKDDDINRLKQTIARAEQKISACVGKVNEVLEDNGSGNNWN